MSIVTFLPEGLPFPRVDVDAVTRILLNPILKPALFLNRML